mmetsp:Transcript_19431/g.36737  ORF Transcript_19431/g.36737 Transcript_19431/m.36737 type:complete len:557 (+) Transcript_19431:180-1850(+)
MASNNTGAAAGGWQQGFSRLVKSVQTTVSNTQENQRKAKEAKEIGKIWDPKTKEWVFFFLDQEVKETTEALQKLQTDYQEKFGKKPPNATMTSSLDQADEPPVKDRLYYDWLEVRTDAADGQIRKAYFKLARKYHPDKNPEGFTPEEAQTKFHQINVAYQILSNPTTRAKYDKEGPAAETPDKEDSGDAANMDPMVFFHVLFASELVEPYIGELWLATTSNNVFKDVSSQAENRADDEDAEAKNEEATKAEEEARDRFMQEQSLLQQKLRQGQCAQHMRRRLADFNPENPEAFQQEAQKEAEKIIAQASTPALGALYCQTLGRSWQVQAETFLGKYGQAGDWWTGPLASTRQTATSISTNMRLLGAAAGAAVAGSAAMKHAQAYQETQIQQEAQKGDTNADAAAASAEDAARKDPNQAEAQLAQALNQSLPAFLKLAWTMNQRDIQQTVKLTCTKLFDDASVPIQDRFIRARAVRLLGQVFAKAGESAVPNARQVLFKSTSQEIQEQLAVATMTTMAKAQGQEVSHEDYATMRLQMQGMMQQQPSEGASNPETKFV